MAESSVSDAAFPQVAPRVAPQVTTPRRTLLSLSLLTALAACDTAGKPGAVVLGGGAPSIGALGAQLSTPLPPGVPLQTALALDYGASLPGYASLYTLSSSGRVIRLFENRPVRPGASARFPTRPEPVIQFGPPAGTEQFVLVVTSQPFVWLQPGEVIDPTTYPRLALDRLGFESRLSSVLGALPPGSWQIQRLTLTTI